MQVPQALGPSEPHPWAVPDPNTTIEQIARDLYESSRLLAYALIRCENAIERDKQLRTGPSEKPGAMTPHS